MSRDPQEESAGRFEGLLQSIIEGTNPNEALNLRSYQLRGYTPQRVEGLLSKSIGAAERNLAAQRSRAISEGVGLASGRGRSMNLSNPFALARLAGNDITQRFAGGFGDLASRRYGIPLEALSTVMNINRANYAPLASLLGLRHAVIGNRANAPGPAILGGLIEGGAKIASGGIA